MVNEFTTLISACLRLSVKSLEPSLNLTVWSVPSTTHLKVLRSDSKKYRAFATVTVATLSGSFFFVSSAEAGAERTVLAREYFYLLHLK